MLVTVLALSALTASFSTHAASAGATPDPSTCANGLYPNATALADFLARVRAGRSDHPMDEDFMSTLERALPGTERRVHRAVLYAPGAAPEALPFSRARIRVDRGRIIDKNGVTVELHAVKDDPMIFTASDFVGADVMVVSASANLKSHFDEEAERFDILRLGYVDKLWTDGPNFAPGPRRELNLSFAKSGRLARLTIWTSEPSRAATGPRALQSVVIDFDDPRALADLDPADEPYGVARGARVIGP